MIEYKEETFDQVINEIKPLLENHYEEIALDRDVIDRKSTRLNSSHSQQSRMPSSA